LRSEAGVEVLLDAVQAEDPLVGMAARVLADSGMAEAASRIEDAVDQSDLTRTAAVVECLIAGLRRFADPLPDGVRAAAGGAILVA
jgi:hypothetical protein